MDTDASLPLQYPLVVTLAKVKLAQKDLQDYAERYSYSNKNLTDPWTSATEPEFLTLAEFLLVGVWKSPRSRKHLSRNSDEEVQEVTRLALAQDSDRLALHTLMALNGVGMPMASAILHWTHSKPFPILDFRAIWSLGIEMPSTYSLSFWQEYVSLTRNLAGSWGCDMRTLDKALWQYSKEHQSQLQFPP